MSARVRKSVAGDEFSITGSHSSRVFHQVFHRAFQTQLNNRYMGYFRPNQSCFMFRFAV